MIGVTGQRSVLNFYVPLLVPIGCIPKGLYDNTSVLRRRFSEGLCCRRFSEGVLRRGFPERALNILLESKTL